MFRRNSVPEGGQKMETGTFNQGQRNGLSTFYYPSGKTKNTVDYENGNMNGLREYVDEAGNIVFSEYYKNGQIQGISKAICNETIRISYNYKNNEKNGDEIFYGDDNKIALVIKFDEGNAYGYTYTGTDGNLVPVVPLKNGTGPIIAYYSNGQKSAEMNALNGLLEGTQKVYYSNGQPAEERTYKNYLLDGRFVRYNIDGKVVYDDAYWNGEEMGTEYSYDKNRQLLFSEPHYMGEAHGDAAIKDLSTNKSNTYKYYCGTLLNIID